MVRFDEELLSDGLDPDQTALIVVDMMNEFVAEGAILETPSARKMVPTLQAMIEASRDAGVTIIYLKQRNRQSGVDAGNLADITPAILSGDAHTPGEQTEIYDELAPEPEDVVVEKQTYSGFFGTELDTILRSQGISTVAVTGTTTHGCCDSTMRDAFFRNYDIVAISDCLATFDIPDQGWGEVTAEEINRIWFSVISSSFGDVLDSTAFIEALDGASRAELTPTPEADNA